LKATRAPGHILTGSLTVALKIKSLGIKLAYVFATRAAKAASEEVSSPDLIRRRGGGRRLRLHQLQSEAPGTKLLSLTAYFSAQRATFTMLLHLRL